MFFGSKSPGFQCSFKTRGSSIAHGARSPCSMWHLCVTASIHGTAWMAPNSAHIDGPPQQLKLMEWVLAMHMWKPVKPVYSYPATWCNMFKYLNHSLAKNKPLCMPVKTCLKLKSSLEIIEFPFPSARVTHLFQPAAPWASLAVDRNPPAITGFREALISNGCNQPQTLHIIDAS